MRMSLPAEGEAREEILSALDAYTQRDVDFRGGRTWSLIYWAGEAHHTLVQDAHNRLLDSNALNPLAFRSLKRLEAEVVQMALSLLNGPEAGVGVMTSGGTESLLCATLAARDRARVRKPWILRPNIVLPESAHPAFDKAAHLFGLGVRRARLGPSGAASPEAIQKCINRNTVLVVASAPSYPWGVVDPVPEIATLTAPRGISLHVDACFGGFILPWLERLGVRFPLWDFRVPGVTSVSADLHKYGFAPKGASVLLYRDMAYMRHQLFVRTGWIGGAYASPTLLGTRAGGPIAAAWASLRGMGGAGFLARAAEAWQAAEQLRAGIAAIDGLRVLGLPHATVVTWAAADSALNLYAVADALQAQGWAVDRQQDPPSVHCTVNASNLPVISRYLEDLRAAVATVRADPGRAAQGEAAVYGLLSAVPLRAVTDRAVRDVLAGMYAPGVTEPEVSPPGGVVERAAGVLEQLRTWRRGSRP